MKRNRNQRTQDTSTLRHLRLIEQESARRSGESISDQLASSKASAALTFGGQGIGYMDELHTLWAEGGLATTLIERTAKVLEEVSSDRLLAWSGYLSQGVDLLSWLRSPETRPDATYLSSSCLSQPLIFTTQIARYANTWEKGLKKAFEAGTIVGLTGHSQGIMSAALIAESPGGAISPDRFADYVHYFAWQGYHMERSNPPAAGEGGSCMAAVSQISLTRLEGIVGKVNKALPAGDRLTISLQNTRTRNVISGHPGALQHLQQALDLIAEKEKASKKAGRFGGSPLSYTWEDLPVSAAFHSHHMENGHAGMTQTVAEIGFSIDASQFHVPVYLCDAEGIIEDDATTVLLKSQFLQPVCWQQTLLRIAEIPELTHVLDMGPADAVARLSMSSLRGTGIAVLPLSVPSGQRGFFEETEDTAPVQYAQFAPKLATLSNGNIIIDNLYTRLTGESPVILPGMTPTTVDAPIVAAGANSGFTSELAGGGQVTEKIFRMRMAELAEGLNPGAEVVFNGLYLDPYLWDLHVRKTGIVQKLKKEGAPLKGVTISAGMPELEEATALLNEFESIGLWHNAFKPGNKAQVKQVCRIAEANTDKTIYVHVEGGKAGGHHSWEDLDELLLETYHLLRAHRNIVLCVGGGIATEERSVELLMGTWSEAYSLPLMPVDAIFLGTATMAVKEATATESVKQALADAAGCEQWVFAGEKGGGVTSGKSQLNADIHYVDNSASRCGRLLDQVAGDADAIAARKDEIIEALNRTCKPYFGDLEKMTYSEVAERLVELMAVGESTQYEDGIWPDVTYRQRIADFIRNAEARLSNQEEGTFASVLRTLAELDAPKKALAQFQKAYPMGSTTTLHPIDVEHFIYKICARPGKPVNFVPVVNEDVRRWFKSDSLWQAQNSHYTADQVLVIPGPEAVKGISSINEPVALLMGRFEKALVDRLQEDGAESPKIDGLWSLKRRDFSKLTGIQEEKGSATLTLEDAVENHTWFEAFGSQFQGPIAGLLASNRIFQGVRSIENPVQALCVPRKGASFSLTTDEFRGISALVYTSPEGEKVHLSLNKNKDHVHVAARPSLVQIEPNKTTELVFDFALEVSERGTHFTQSFDDYNQAIARFYQESLFGRSLKAPTLFETVSGDVVVEPERTRAYHAITGGSSNDQVALNMGFSLVWEPVFTAMSTPELSQGLLRLVHLSNTFETHSGWPISAGESVEVSAQVTRVENRGQGRTIQTAASIHRDGELCLTIESAFFVRDSFADAPVALHAKEWKTWTTTLGSSAEVDVLRGLEFISMNGKAAFAPGDLLDVEVDITELRPRNGEVSFGAHGSILRDGEEIGSIEGSWTGTHANHPVVAFFDAIAEHATQETPTARKTLAKRSDRTPGVMRSFSEVGLDRNSIHVSRLMAGLGSLDDVIVHGMWTSARAHAFLVNDVLQGNADRIRSFKGEFLAPAYLGESISLRAFRVASVDGDTRVEIRVDATREGGEVPLMSASALIRSPRVAYIFPGQGIQQKGMGMEAYASSTAARNIWEKADSFTRSKLGFSILRIVRENPKEIVVDGTPQIHDNGVIHLTQFTQVAMAVLSQAHVAQLEESGLLNDDAVVCGHSVGEYNAIGALGDVLPLEVIIQTVYERGQEMHRLVERDARGESGYRMGVIRPHYAKLDEAGAKKLVDQIAKKTGLPLQIVNYNIMGRQYSVVGKIEAIRVLQEELTALAPAGAKAPYIEVPGIDVPFHSRVLEGGVGRFRDTLNSRFPAKIPVNKLIGRYIPNLVPRVFNVELDYVKEVAEYTQSEPLNALLADWDNVGTDAQKVGRTLLIELLAWQFASPVRWIETQALLLNRPDAGGMGIDEILELGVGYQPTLSNMARYSKTLLRATAGDPEIRNIEADADEVFYRIGDPEEVIVEEMDETSAPAEATAAAPVVVAAAPVAAAPAAAAGPVDDSPLPIQEALLGLLALQSKVTPAQISLSETIDELFEGVSSRRNQVLLDIGAEFNLGTIDGAHEQPLQELVGEIERRSGTYKGPGKYLRASVDEAMKRVLGRTGISKKDAITYLSTSYGLGEGLSEATLLTLALGTREGDSSRGGGLATVSADVPTSKSGGQAILDQATQALASVRGISLGKQGGQASGSGSAVDAAVVKALEERLAGRNGALMRVAEDLASHLGHALAPVGPGLSAPDAKQERIDQFVAEHSTDYEELVQPRFSAKKHVAFQSSWAWAQRDIARLAFEGVHGRLTDADITREATRLGNLRSPRVDATARWYQDWAKKEKCSAVEKALGSVLSADGNAPMGWIPTRPKLTISSTGTLDYEEVPVTGKKAIQSFLNALHLKKKTPIVSIGDEGAWNPSFAEVLQKASEEKLSFAGRTAVVTGAGPNSIALEMVRHLLHGGARVIVTTSSYNATRVGTYRDLFQENAGPGAELHVVPFNQTSLQDVKAFVSWLFSTVTEQAGAEVKITKRPFVPDLLIPFAAIKDLATLDDLGARSQAALRTMLLSVETLIAGIAKEYKANGIPSTPCHVVLPLSPNHGVFGGDGTYAETKAALEVLAHKWVSEREAWGACTTLCMARIGWVRGTGLMDANNPVAAELEDKTGVRTFSNGEMAAMLIALSSDTAREAASAAPLHADLTGGFSDIDDLKGTVDGIRNSLEESMKNARLRSSLMTLTQKQDKEAPLGPIHALPTWPRPTLAAVREPISGTKKAKLEDLIVIIGAGELGPCGTARTRFELEVSEELSPAAILELAWTTGLIRYEDSGRGGTWMDLETGEEVHESDIASTYRDAVRERVGIRFVDPEGAGFDPRSLDVMTPVFLEKDMTFPVSSEEEARLFVESEPETSSAAYDESAELWKVTRKAGSEIRVPRKTRLNRFVVGQIPSGFDLARYGIPKDMVENTDRLTLFNLIATVDAFLSAGLTPEELLQWVHPARVANTQGCGIGGMESLQRLYTDPVLDKERQSDVLQETLINVVAGYVVQSYVGSYGSMSHPVAACATAAVSLEEAVDKIRVGKADVVVAGGYDDIGRAGFMGFADMNATHNSDEMLAMGLEPHQFSRANDVRRKGFVEAQGGGTFLVTRGDVAKKMGVPVRAVVAYAGSYGDGIQKSVPAPGMGALAAAMGGADSPLGKALDSVGLVTDDIALVYKHDTSTNANDPNENKLHHQLQEALGRTPGNPLFVVSQKTLTGHSKGGAAAWQIGGLMQALASGVIPGNRNLDNVDPQMEAFGHMAFSNASLNPGVGNLKAGLVTSLGFGHVSGLALLVHPGVFLNLLSAKERATYLSRVEARERLETKDLAAAWMGRKPLYEKRGHRRFHGADGSAEQAAEEVALLTNPDARLHSNSIFGNGSEK